MNGTILQAYLPSDFPRFVTSRLCFRALTLYLYASDACRSTDDDDSKREIVRTVKETIENYNVDWSLLIADKSRTKYSVAKKLIAFFAIGTVTLYAYVK